MEVLVIGAGACGLTAARALAEKHHSVTVVEARDRVGGRIHTIKSGFSLPVEGGAEFMHGKQPQTLALIEEAKSGAVLLEGNRYQLWNGQLQDGDFFDGQWNELTEALQKLRTDTDMASFLSAHFGKEEFRALRQKVKGFVEGYDAAELNKVSALALKEEWAESDDEHQYHIDGGYSKLMLHLHEKVTRAQGAVVLSAPVTEIQWSKGNVRVVTATGRLLEAGRVIVTVPLGVLQRDKIRFTPELPAHRAAFRKIGFGGVMKFFIEFKSAFWEHRRERPLNELAFMFSDAEVPTWWSQLPAKQPLLTGWLGGPGTTRASHSRDALFEKAMKSLQYIFDCSRLQLNSEIVNWDIADWTTDPYAFGAYAFPTVDTKEARSFLSRPIHDTIFFGGEALYEGAAMGTVEAALANGHIVAEKIL
jgi:monoamine oxidase